MHNKLLVLGTFIASLFIALPSIAAPEPTKVNQCTKTIVKYVGGRFEGDPYSGSAISLTNGLESLSTNNFLTWGNSRKGDEVSVCLKTIPSNCPKGDDRGKEFLVTNLRTNKKFVLVKGYHFCGGA